MANVGVSGRFSLTRLSLCLGLAFGGGVVWAQTAVPAATEVSAAEQPVGTLKEMVISGSRVEQDIDDVSATITTISAEKMKRENPADLQDLFKDEVGVSVRVPPNRATAGSSTGRGGNEGVNIRGMEGDQVRLQVDGVSLPVSFSNGPHFVGRGDAMDPEGFKRVEILRGASSTQFGSDGLAGAVSFMTKDPGDLLTLGNPTQFNLKLGYSSADRAWQLAPSFAFKGETVQGMVLTSLRTGHETDTMGTNSTSTANRTTANPMDFKSGYLLSKFIFTPDRTHQIKLTAETLRRETESNVLSARSATQTNFATDDAVDRDLLKLDYRYTPARAWFDVLNASVYNQQYYNQQFSLDERPVNPLMRTRDRKFWQDTWGANVQVETNFGKETAHRLVSGLDFTYSDITSIYSGVYTPRNPALTGCTGTTVSNCQPFPTQKNFPDTKYLTLGAFVHDEMDFGKVSITPGVRYDAFKLDPQSDPYYQVSNTIAPSALSGSAISPRLGAVWKIAPMVQPFAQYAHGFRAPKPDQVNGGSGTNLTATAPYMSIGNPALKPETSDTYELGLRGKEGAYRYSATVFHSRYLDFISNKIVSGAGTALNPSVYQSVNLGEVVISGFELRGDVALSRHWGLSAAYAHAKGDSYQGATTNPLNTIDPDKLVVGVNYSRGALWGASMNVTTVERQTRPETTTLVRPAGYTVVDLTGWYQFGKATSLQAGIGNLFDEKYVQWADVRDLAATSTVIDAYTQPGRNFKISLTHSF
jgi:hemoglobin/transferrin/lactoferrin receptor protein